MTRRAHAWMPASPCGDGCLPSTSPRVSWPTVVTRAFTFIAVLACAPILVVARLVPVSARETLLRAGARGLLRCVGMRVSSPTSATGVDTTEGSSSWHHTCRGPTCWWSWLWPSRVRGARRPARVGCARVAGAADAGDPDRARTLRALPGVVDIVRSRLDSGERVAVFPEGTTWCGRAYGGFRSALFEAAIDAECPVQPIGFVYLDHTGVRTTGPAFVGEETIGASIARLVRSRGLVASVTLAPLEWPGTDRRDLAARCERAVRPTERIAVPHVVRTTAPGACRQHLRK